MRSVIKSSIHSRDKYILVHPGLYWPSHHGCTFACRPMPPKRFYNEVPRAESGCERVSRTVRQTYLSGYVEHKNRGARSMNSNQMDRAQGIKAIERRMANGTAKALRDEVVKQYGGAQK